MDNTLITGATGYIGGHLTTALQIEREITAYSLRVNGLPKNLEEFSTVIHLSALVHQQTEQPEAEYFRVNTEQTIALATVAKQSSVNQFIFFSTVAVYGEDGFLDKSNHPKLDENTECQPKTPYGKSKLEAEAQLLALADDNFTVSIIRPPIVYGPNCPGNMSRLNKLIQLFPILPLGNQVNKRSMVHIDNLVHFTERLLDTKASGIFIPQDNETLTIQEISKALAEANRKRRLLIKLPNFILGLLHTIKPQLIESLYGELVFDSTQSNQHIGYEAKINAKAGLQNI